LFPDFTFGLRLSGPADSDNVPEHNQANNDKAQCEKSVLESPDIAAPTTSSADVVATTPKVVKAQKVFRPKE
jgi:hypothetical protein